MPEEPDDIPEIETAPITRDAQSERPELIDEIETAPEWRTGGRRPERDRGDN